MKPGLIQIYKVHSSGKNEPNFCVSTSTLRCGVYFLQTIQTEANWHTSDYLEQHAQECIIRNTQKYGFNVCGFARDNSTIMAKMPRHLSKSDTNAASFLNLLANSVGGGGGGVQVLFSN